LLDETAPFNPVAPYGISKVQAEEGLLDLATDTFSPVLLRSATAYGVSPQLRCDVVLNNLVAWAVATGKVHIKSDGMAWRPLVHVEDICRAFIAVLEAERDAVHAQAFNVVARGENYRIRDVATIVAELVGCDVEFAGDASADARNYRVDGTKDCRNPASLPTGMDRPPRCRATSRGLLHPPGHRRGLRGVALPANRPAKAVAGSRGSHS
jgi:nucleoside-diphosphate-sugar epimerase